MSTPARARRETTAQKCAASSQTLPEVGAAASVSISNISPAVAGSEEGSFGRASPMCDFLQKTEQIRSGGSEPAQYAELTALLGNALRFAVYVHKFVVKACVIVVTEMLSIERAERARWVVTRENWAKVQENLRSIQTTMSIELPHEISLSHNSRQQPTHATSP